VFPGIGGHAFVHQHHHAVHKPHHLIHPALPRRPADGHVLLHPDPTHAHQQRRVASPAPPTSDLPARPLIHRHGHRLTPSSHLLARVARDQQVLHGPPCPRLDLRGHKDTACIQAICRPTKTRSPAALWWATPGKRAARRAGSRRRAPDRGGSGLPAACAAPCSFTRGAGCVASTDYDDVDADLQMRRGLWYKRARPRWRITTTGVVTPALPPAVQPARSIAAPPRARTCRNRAQPRSRAAGTPP